ncbi:MAG: hypothetical protein AUK59_02795 [Candidatus Altarchaeum sp. CG2_30_32_3053]|nr:MAG: hypothetical protein AUK59_02795 [Candidatus Altarchaeum sp. CG2_30_32_3053]
MDEISEISDEKISNIFKESAKNLNFSFSDDDLTDLCIYDMTDGTRTSTNLKGSNAYIDGGLFALRFTNILRALGAKNIYLNVIHTGHKKRVNYKDIYEAMLKLVDVYLNYANKYNAKLKFLGNLDERIDFGDSKFNLREILKGLEKKTQNNKGITIHILINFSTRWLSKHEEIFKILPEINVVVRHTKGYINGDMQIFGRMDNHSLVYAQNGSSSTNWSNRQIVYLAAICLKSYILNKGTHLTKIYVSGEDEKVREDREIKLSLIHKDFYDEKEKENRQENEDKENNKNKFKKRAIIFSAVGPEIYEF